MGEGRETGAALRRAQPARQVTEVEALELPASHEGDVVGVVGLRPGHGRPRAVRDGMLAGQPRKARRYLLGSPLFLARALAERRAPRRAQAAE